MRESLMCVLSGIVGIIFAISCGVVDGVGNRDAIAESYSTLQIYTETGACVDSDGNYLPDDMEDFLNEAKINDWVVSASWDNDCNYAEGSVSTNWRIAYIK